MRSYLSAAALAAVLAAAPAAFAQPPPPPPEVGIGMLALTTIAPTGTAKLSVYSPSFQNREDIPFENTQYRGNIFPGLNWNAGPAATKSFVIIMQDTDGVVNGAPILHWTMYNIPASVTSLPVAMTAPPAGASYGPNIRGPAQAYMGPRTPPGMKHHYHLQVFALDTTIPASPTLTFDALAAAMKGHVIGNGQAIGMGSADPTAAPPVGGGGSRGAGGGRPPA